MPATAAELVRSLPSFLSPVLLRIPGQSPVLDPPQRSELTFSAGVHPAWLVRPFHLMRRRVVAVGRGPLRHLARCPRLAGARLDAIPRELRVTVP
jgi:hypothetical protein